jgi:DNA-directed RNA polymerase specialized sigma24 family protein
MSDQCFSEEDWGNLYLVLKPRVARWVCTSRIPTWTQQRYAIIEDIVQDTLLKMVDYAQRAERGEARVIVSLESICAVAAYHCYVDAFRRDRRLLPLILDHEESDESSISRAAVDPSEQAIDNIQEELLFIQVAGWIVNFPDKQRTALLVDLANRMYFDPFQSTPLQEALACVGIDMRDYKKPVPYDTRARARHAAHLSLAYKRLALQAYMQRYMFVA